ncbi:MAG: response regulator, partial [Candidatus Dadabacteria bacterium]|nr:response regulator [Candidatus Dadabacteria bacterium]
RSVASTAGCITLMSLRRNAFSPKEVSLLESIAEQIGLAIVNARYVQEIETNERRLKALVGSVDEIVCEMDGNGAYLGIWTDNERLLVRPKEEMLGRMLSEFYPAGFASKMTDLIRRVISTRKSESAEYRIATDSGEREFRVRVNPIVTSGGARQGTASVLFRDITDSKVLQTRLLRSQRLDSLGKLAGGIAHDLNNILQPIMMSIELLQRKTADAQSRKWLEILATSAQRGSDLIKQILSFARGLESSKQPLDMKGVVGVVQKLVRETFPKLICVHVDIKDDLPPVLADYTQINQVLMNLCVNSRDAMPGGGDIFIEARRLRADRESLPPFFDPGHKEYIEISVSDTGTGIPAEDLDRVFDPFFTTKGLDKGTGLGLSTTYGIVKDHDGYINAESEPGRGTKFTIYLPAIESEDVEDPARGLYSGIPRGRGELILVVDDESMITDMARSILEEYKYRVVVASNGKEATDIFHDRKDEVYAAIVDMMMPVMGGKATIKTLKKVSPSLKVIAISGYQREHELVDMHDVEVDAFLPKPFDTETLLQTLNQVLV